jgi:excisionase family DNA binding protein
MAPTATRSLDAIKKDYRRRLITLQDAADRLGVDQRTLRRRIADGLLPAYKIAGTRSIRVDERDVDALAERIPTVGAL